MIDDGWQDCGKGTRWTDKAWKVNAKFDQDFGASRAAVEKTGSRLGPWLSPGCLFGSRSMVARYGAAGFEALDDWMSLAGPKYMKLLEDRMVEMTRPWLMPAVSPREFLVFLRSTAGMSH